MNDRTRMTRFIKIYAIYEGILNEPTKNIVLAYESYVLKYPVESELNATEFSQMKTFILSKQWKQ